jgi:hypothetical protein
LSFAFREARVAEIASGFHFHGEPVGFLEFTEAAVRECRAHRWFEKDTYLDQVIGLRSYPAKPQPLPNRGQLKRSDVINAAFK